MCAGGGGARARIGAEKRVQLANGALRCAGAWRYLFDVVDLLHCAGFPALNERDSIAQL